MKYQVVYYKLKKDNKQAKQEAIFYNIEDASRWEQHIKNEGFINSEIIPIF